MQRCRRAIAMVLSAVLLTGCEGITTGTEIANIALQPAEGGVPGSYLPTQFTLTPEMNPVAFNLRAEFTQDPAESGKWNAYQVALTHNGAPVATRIVNINHPQTNAQGSAPPPSATIHTLFYVDVQNSGEHELTITAAQPVAVTLREPRVDARRNVQRPPK